MVSEDDPNLEVAWYDSSVPKWVDVTDYLKTFKVTDAGCLKVPSAQVVLKNKNGRFTSGANEIDSYAKVRIRGDVRGSWDMIFDGRYLDYKGNFTRKTHDLMLICYDRIGEKTLNDTITASYGSQDEAGHTSWTLKEVIENFLSNPDSGSATGITLDTDAGDITTVHARQESNFLRDSLLDALRRIAERINYDGYFEESAGVDYLRFKEAGTVNASPAVTLDHPFIKIEPERSIREIRNHIFPWGGVEIGVPEDADRWTEDGVSKYSPAAWIAHDANSSVADDTGVYKINTESVKITVTSGQLGAYLDLSRTAEGDVDATSRFETLNFWIRHGNVYEGGVYIKVKLVDSAANKIAYAGGVYLAKKNNWYEHGLPVGTDTPIEASEADGEDLNRWGYVTGSTFNWTIAEIHFELGLLGKSPFYIDGLWFQGGRKIDPILYPSDNPAKTDSGSITIYGRRVYHHIDETLASILNAGAAADIILGIRKNPFRRITCKKGAKIWVRPHQVVTLNLSEYGITSESWRPVEIETLWQNKKLRTTFTLVPSTFKLSSYAFKQYDLPWLRRD